MAVQLQSAQTLPGGAKKAEYVVDTVADITTLPTTGDIAQGSTAFVIQGSFVYMKNGTGDWVVI